MELELTNCSNLKMDYVVDLPKELNARTVPPILKNLQGENVAVYTLDMANVRMVRPAGICFLVCMLAVLAPKRGSRGVRIRIVNLSESVESFLCTLGFFSTLKKRVALIGSEDMIANDERRRRRNEKAANDAYWRGGQESDKPLVWPIETIFEKSTEGYLSNSQFESDCARFIDRAVVKFRGLFIEELGMAHVDQGLFWQSNRELYKNIYDHSESWGIVSVFGRPNHGTIFTYHDVGIGMLASINVNHEEGEQLTSDLEAIKWAIVDGNSSKKIGNEGWTENSGVGLSIVSEMVIESRGRIEIRTGGTIYCHDGQSDWRSLNTDFFPGTHVSVFIPSN